MKKILKVGTCLLCLLIAVLSVTYIRSEIKYGRLLAANADGERSNIGRQEIPTVSGDRKDFHERVWQFNKLWLDRHERDVSNEITKYLEDPSSYLRLQAVRALGRIEDPKAEQPISRLQERLSTKDEERKLGVRRITVQLALGRIRSHGKTGRDKCETVARCFDMSYSQVLRLIRELNNKLLNPKTARGMLNSPAYQIELEFLDILYNLRRQGQEIDSLSASEFRRIPAFARRLKGAETTVEREVQGMLAYASDSDTYGFDEEYYLNLGSPATDMLLAHLGKMSRSPDAFNLESDNTIGYAQLFRTAGLTRDKRFRPVMLALMKALDQPKNNKTYAKARYYLEQGITFLEKEQLPKFPPA